MLELLQARLSAWIRAFVGKHTENDYSYRQIGKDIVILARAGSMTDSEHAENKGYACLDFFS